MATDQNEEIEDLNSPENIQKRVESNLLLGVMKELNALEGYPRMQVFITHGFLELLANTLIKKKAKNGKKIVKDTRTYSYSTQILILNELEIISDKEYEVLNWFRKLRNKAAHEALFQITYKDLSQINLDNKKVDVSDFTKLCNYLILNMINHRMDVLGPDIAPTMGSWEAE